MPQPLGCQVPAPGGLIIDAGIAIHICGVTKRFTQPRKARDVLKHPFRFQRLKVLSGVDLDVAQGSLTGLLGPNGAGKTTLLRILTASVSPDDGQVHILGRNALKQPAQARQQVGVVLGEERSFFWRLTAEQNLRFFAALCNMDGHSARARIDELVGVLNLESEIKTPFRNLSTGWRHRLALARALLHDPQVLLMDEPTSGLDPGATVRARKLIRDALVQKMGKTVLLATHNLEETRQICDQVAFLKNGRIWAHGKTEATLSKVSEVFDMDDDRYRVSGG